MERGVGGGVQWRVLLGGGCGEGKVATEPRPQNHLPSQFTPYKEAAFSACLSYGLHFSALFLSAEASLVCVFFIPRRAEEKSVVWMRGVCSFWGVL